MVKTIEDVKQETYDRLVEMGYDREIITPLVNSFWKIIKRNWQGEPTIILTDEGQEIYL